MIEGIINLRGKGPRLYTSSGLRVENRLENEHALRVKCMPFTLH
jgi:hypothetical protein